MTDDTLNIALPSCRVYYKHENERLHSYWDESTNTHLTPWIDLGVHGDIRLLQSGRNISI